MRICLSSVEHCNFEEFLLKIVVIVSDVVDEEYNSSFESLTS